MRWEDLKAAALERADAHDRAQDYTYSGYLLRLLVDEVERLRLQVSAQDDASIHWQRRYAACGAEVTDLRRQVGDLEELLRREEARR